MKIEEYHMSCILSSFILILCFEDFSQKHHHHFEILRMLFILNDKFSILDKDLSKSVLVIAACNILAYFTVYNVSYTFRGSGIISWLKH